VGIDTAIAVGAILLSALVAMDRMFSKSLSIREHEEFRRNIDKEFDRKDHQRERDFDAILDRIRVLEQTRPTTGELEARLKPPPQSHD
jgi:predicted RNA-binding protein with RPS1 domain